MTWEIFQVSAAQAAMMGVASAGEIPGGRGIGNADMRPGHGAGHNCHAKDSEQMHGEIAAG
ncbi:hypothetical protein LMTR3_21000 [Bradyrhizobium sp. LMTR 3]|nr:hypothetical protein LMTR3_21000 [Bradyrhizobium sp. LMTR 3]